MDEDLLQRAHNQSKNVFLTIKFLQFENTAAATVMGNTFITLVLMEGTEF